MKYFSAFSGIGGFELGFPKDWECVGYSEIESQALKIYRKHFPNHKNYGDITKIKPADLPDFDLLVGGFPCQAFSIAGKRGGFNDTRGTLFFEIARIVKAKKPRLLLLENVKGLLSHDRGRTFGTILNALDELGYDTEWMVLDGYNFDGAPRSRVFMLAMHRKRKIAPRKRKSETLPLYACIREGHGNKNTAAGKQKIVRGSERIIRTFAPLPDWLDGWDIFYRQKKSAGKRSERKGD